MLAHDSAIAGTKKARHEPFDPRWEMSFCAVFNLRQQTLITLTMLVLMATATRRCVAHALAMLRFGIGDLMYT